MSSRRLTAPPCPFAASMISPTNRSAKLCSLRPRAKLTSQRSASAVPLARHLLPFPLRAVSGTGLLAVPDAGGVEGASDDLVAHTREVTDTTTADQHDGVLLEVVADARDIRGDLDPRGQPYARDL